MATMREKRPGVWEVRAFTGWDERGDAHLPRGSRSTSNEPTSSSNPQGITPRRELRRRDA